MYDDHEIWTEPMAYAAWLTRILVEAGNVMVFDASTKKSHDITNFSRLNMNGLQVQITINEKPEKED